MECTYEIGTEHGVSSQNIRSHSFYGYCVQIRGGRGVGGEQRKYPKLKTVKQQQQKAPELANRESGCLQITQGADRAALMAVGSETGLGVQ